MKRTAARIFLFLLLGAVINVAVAWGSALWPRSGNRPSASTASTDIPGAPDQWGQPLVYAVLYRPGRTTTHANWMFFTAPDGQALMSAEERRRLLPGASTICNFGRDDAPEGADHRVPDGAADPDPVRLAIAHRTDLRIQGVYLAVNRCGLPLRAMEYVGVLQANSDAEARTLRHSLAVWAEGVPLEPPTTTGIPDRLCLPLRPVLPGFVFNSLFYSALLACTRYGFHQYRLDRRARRSLCPTCGYPIGTSAVCTECGKPVKPRGGGSDQDPKGNVAD